jgi:sugar O-acyltransferase (sialic acid O-acetyltransferase NeuD family)
MKPVIIFGIGELAEVAHFYFNNDKYKIAAFTVDSSYLSKQEFCGLAVVPFEEIENLYPPAKFDMFVAVGYTKLNQIRAIKCEEAKVKGYKLISYVSSKATTWNDLTIGENCFILENNIIQPFVKIGNNVIIWTGSNIAHHTEINDNCFISCQASIAGRVKIGKNCFIGINATIRDNISIADNCIIGAGALILYDTKSNEVYKGNKAKLADYFSNYIGI